MTLRHPHEVEINGQTLAGIIERHQQWLRSSFKTGERAILVGADLRRTDLAGQDLREADFTGADLA
ncbi:MAG TPA: pentapeptide repeat-containing protein, partial [Bryobacterales bacterium]|nr:pentapeptide repeat-containing protein [Bryobacterales bacterium]